MKHSLAQRVRHAVQVLRGKKSVSSYARSMVGLSEQVAPWRDNPYEQVRHYRHWVYVAVRAIASRVSGTPLDFYRIDTGERLDASHPIRRLMREVNPFETAVSLWQRTMMFLELTGNAYWYAPKNALGAVAELWMLPSQHMHVVPDKERFIKGYTFRNGGIEENFSADEIIHLKYPSPESPFYGSGPLQAAADAVDSHEAMKTAERRTFENGVFPGLAVQTAEKLSSDVRKRLEESLRQGFSGPDRAGRALILEQGLTVRPFTYSPREMDFLESARVTRDEILSVFGVPAAVAGVSEDVNRASAEAMLWTFSENTILPKLRLLDAQLTQDLCARFDPRIEARFGSPLPKARADDRADMVARIQSGITTINEERSRLGLAPREVENITPREQSSQKRPLFTGTLKATDNIRQTDQTATTPQSSNDEDASHEKVEPTRKAQAVCAIQAALRGQCKRLLGTSAPDSTPLAIRVGQVLDDPREPDRLLAPLVPALVCEGLNRTEARIMGERIVTELMSLAREIFLDEAITLTPLVIRNAYAQTLLPKAQSLLENDTPTEPSDCGI